MTSPPILPPDLVAALTGTYSLGVTLGALHMDIGALLITCGIVAASYGGARTAFAHTVNGRAEEIEGLMSKLGEQVAYLVAIDTKT